jgi:hypothetical protein
MIESKLTERHFLQPVAITGMHSDQVKKMYERKGMPVTRDKARVWTQRYIRYSCQSTCMDTKTHTLLVSKHVYGHKDIYVTRVKARV